MKKKLVSIFCMMVTLVHGTVMTADAVIKKNPQQETFVHKVAVACGAGCVLAHTFFPKLVNPLIDDVSSKTLSYTLIAGITASIVYQNFFATVKYEDVELLMRNAQALVDMPTPSNAAKDALTKSATRIGKASVTQAVQSMVTATRLAERQKAHKQLLKALSEVNNMYNAQGKRFTVKLS
jgi:hypothetical protein